MDLNWLGPWQGAALAGVVTLVVAGLARVLRWPGVATAAAGCGLAAGWLLVLGEISASPRQLSERLPLVAVAAAAAGTLLVAAGWRVTAWVLAVPVALAGAWWLGGAPMVLPDLLRAALPLAALAILAVLTLVALDGPLLGALAAASLAGGIWLAAPLGPWLPLVAALLAALLAGTAGGLAWPPGARLAPALGLAAVAAGPVMARGTVADWLAGAAPLAVLWLGPAFGARLGGKAGAMAGWVLAASLPLLLLWLARRN